MNCPYCGRAVDNTATVCPNCGGPLTPVVLPQPEMPPNAGPDQPVPGVPDSSAGPHGALPLEAARLPGSGASTPPEPPPYQPPPYPPTPPGGASPVPETDRAWVPPSPPPPAPNRTPLIVGGVILAGIVALCCLGGAFLALGAFIATPTTRQVSTSPTPFVLTFPSLTVPTPNATFPSFTISTPNVTDTTPPRMSLEAFKALYDDPDQRPLIIDVRTAETYSNGHIAGAISFPESDVDARIAELPKDKLIVAYCQ